VPSPIIKSHVRVLRPGEYEILRSGVPSLENQTRLDVLLTTGLRYVEAQRLQENPDWFDRRFIHMPEWAQRKAKRKQRERWVKLSDRGKTVVPFFFKTRPLPDWNVWTENLQRWAGRAHLDPRSLRVKTTRKTWESWLLAQHPERTMEIVLSMGHNEVTSIRHYAGLPFTKADKEGMLEWTSGWAEAR